MQSIRSAWLGARALLITMFSAAAVALSAAKADAQLTEIYTGLDYNEGFTSTSDGQPFADLGTNQTAEMIFNLPPEYSGTQYSTSALTSWNISSGVGGVTLSSSAPGDMLYINQIDFSDGLITGWYYDVAGPSPGYEPQMESQSSNVLMPDGVGVSQDNVNNGTEYNQVQSQGAWIEAVPEPRADEEIIAGAGLLALFRLRRQKGMACQR